MTPTRALLIAGYLAAIAAANLLAATYGPAITPITAFVLIGFDFSCRDYLQQTWEGGPLWTKMALLIAAGGFISWFINRDAAQIALASTVSFVLASSLDALVFAAVGKRVGRLVRWNSTNLVGAAIDSLLFPTLAFGVLIPSVVVAQFAAKVAGGFVWSLALVRVRR